MGKSRLIVRDRNGGLNALRRQILVDLAGNAVKVGVLESAGTHRGGKSQKRRAKKFSPKAKHPQAPATMPTVAQIAFWNEFGTETIPSRPAIRRAMQGKGRKAIERVVSKTTSAVVRRKMGVDQALQRIGLVAQAQIRREITELDSPPNAPLTIELKGSSNPLIDSGQLRRSINYEIVRGRKAVAAAKRRAPGHS